MDELLKELFNEEAITFASLWLAGALTTLARTLRDSDYRDCWRAFGAVALGGLVSCCVVGIAGAHIGGHFTSRSYSIAVAIALGIIGKPAESYVRAMASLAVRVKVPEQEEPKQ